MPAAEWSADDERCFRDLASYCVPVLMRARLFASRLPPLLRSAVLLSRSLSNRTLFTFLSLALNLFLLLAGGNSIPNAERGAR